MAHNAPETAARGARHPPSLFAAVSHQSPFPILSDITKVLDLGQTVHAATHLVHTEPSYTYKSSRDNGKF